MALIGRWSGSRAAVNFVILFAAFLVGLNFTILTILLPTISAELGCTVEEAAWVTIGPLFASVVFAPMIGNIADLYSRRTTIWQLGFALHLIGLLIAGFSSSITVLINARLLTGIAMACDAPTGFAIMVAGLPATQRGKVSAYQTAVNTIGPSLGVGLGGILSTVIGWRMMFLGIHQYRRSVTMHDCHLHMFFDARFLLSDIWFSRAVCAVILRVAGLLRHPPGRRAPPTDAPPRRRGSQGQHRGQDGEGQSCFRLRRRGGVRTGYAAAAALCESRQ